MLNQPRVLREIGVADSHTGKLLPIHCYTIRGRVFKNGSGIDQDDLIDVTLEACVHPDDESLFRQLWSVDSTTPTRVCQINEWDLKDDTKWTRHL
jgi:hypothetical protein